MRVLLTQFKVSNCFILGLIGEFEINTAGKRYTFKDSVEYCEQSGGELMEINFLEV